MKKLLLLFYILSFSFVTFAEEKIHSLSLKEYDLERKIIIALDSYLSPQNYVVKVKIDGKRVELAPEQTSSEEGRINTTGQLPGFESQQPLYNPSITKAVGETYWSINKLKIDLVMHKEISPSVDQYIREAIPVIIAFDAGRGDIFNYKPILPEKLVTREERKQAIEDEKKLLEDQKKKKKEEKEKLLEDQKKKKKEELSYFNLTLFEWILVALFCSLVFAIAFYFIRKVSKLNSEINLLQEELGEEVPVEDFSIEKEKEELQKEKKEREERRDNEVHNSIIRDENERILNKIITQLIGREDIKQMLIEHYINQKDLLKKFIDFQSIIGPLTSKQLFQDKIETDLFLEIQEKVKDVEVPAEEQAKILNEIHSFALMKELQNPVNLKSDPYKFIHELSVGQINYLIKDEPTNIKAIVLSRLDSEKASLILEKLDKDQRSQVVLDLGKLKELPLDLLEKVAFDLASKINDLPDENTADFDGIDMIIDVLGESSSVVRKELINNMRISDRTLSGKVESKLFIFDFIKIVPKDILLKIVRSLSSSEVITAIHGAEKEIKEKIIFCFPEDSRMTLVAKVKSQKPSPEEVKINRKKIISTFQKLAAEGKINLRDYAQDYEAKNNKPTVEKKE